MVVTCIGDSITYGQLLEDPGKAWPRLLDAFLVVNSAGVPGDTTRLGLERFPRDVQEIEPDFVIIQFGHNDANRWRTDRGLNRVSPAAFRANLIEMIDRSRTFGAEPLLCSLTPTFRNMQLAEDVAHYDQIIRRVSDDEHAHLIDVRSAFSNADWLLLPDGLHLSERGHVIYAETVNEALMAAVRG